MNRVPPPRPSCRVRLAVRAAAVAVLAVVAAAGPADAARFHVQVGGTRASGPSAPGDWTAGNCYPTIAAAAAAAAAPDTVLLFNEDHDVTGAVTIPAFLGNLRLDGDNSDTRIVCGANGRLSVDPASVSFTARGLTVTETATTSDYAAFIVEDPGATLTGAVFEDCFFQGNRGSDKVRPGGSCVTAVTVAGPVSLEFTRCDFDGNSTDGQGGALHVGEGYDVRIVESNFTDNTSFLGNGGVAGGGGAIAVWSIQNPSSLTLEDCFVSGSQSWGPGGAMFLRDCSLTLTRTEISDSRSAAGGVTQWASGTGIFSVLTIVHPQTMSLTVDACTFRRNKVNLIPGSECDGGAILVKGVSGGIVDVDVSDSLFDSNYARQGAGIYVGRYATGTIRRCTFVDNSVSYQGGATYKGGANPDCLGETAVYEYCEFIRNSSGVNEDGTPSGDPGNGGAFATRLYPRAEFANCTFVENLALGTVHRGDAIFQTRETGALDDDLKRCQLRNCVFYAPSGANAQVDSDADGFSLVTNCAWESGQFLCTGVSPAQTVTLTGSPFVSLTDPEPASGSPLLDAALDVGLMLDLAMNPVPNGVAPDIGAFENQSPVAAPLASDGSGPVLGVQPNPFRAAITVAYDLPRAGFVQLEVFDVTGRRVAVLDRGVRSAGRREARWTGADESGNRLASGVYCVRLRTEDRESVRKIVLTR